jgi:capsular polysaccharide export protein
LTLSPLTSGDGALRDPRSLALISPHTWRLQHLQAFFPETRLRPFLTTYLCDAWAVWGTRGPIWLWRGLALGQYTVLTLEDGFLRSNGLAKSGAAQVSLVADDLGIYFDARRSSRFETLMAASLTPAWQAAGASARRRVIDARLTKYNLTSALEKPKGRYILVADQVYGDHGVSGGLANANTFSAMLATVRRERPNARIVVRTHPDVAAGHRRGYLTGRPDHGVEVTSGGDSAAALDHADEVWTVSSLIGFEALMRSIPVKTFGMPFYAGYGLTDDRANGGGADAARRRRTVAGVTVDHLAAVAYLRYTRYADPETAQPISFDAAVDWLQRRRVA